MDFQITIKYDGKMIRLAVEQTFADHRVERYKVNANNGSVIIESNRPLFRNKGLKHRPPQWKAIEGNGLSPYVLIKIYKAINLHIEPDKKE